MTTWSSRDRRASALLAGVGIVHAIAAIVLDKPWAKEITKRVAAGKTLHVEHYMTMGFWYAAAAGAIFLLHRGGGDLAGGSELPFGRSSERSEP